MVLCCRPPPETENSMGFDKYYVHILSNTHWDREWYMPHEKYLVRLVKLCDRLLDIMEKEPRYIFIADGQFSMIDDYLQVKPMNLQRIKKLVGEGRLEVGPWFTQPLETVATGEALIRNLHYGTEGAEKLGRAMKFSYEVDEFGHASQTPQILKGFGIEGVIAWRGIPAGARSAFRWASPDGSEVIMLYSNWGYGEATALPLGDEDFSEIIDGSEIRRDGLRKRVKHLKDMRTGFSDTDRIMWLNGIDHSFPQPDLYEVIDKINAAFPELSVKQTTCEDYLEQVKKAHEKYSVRMPRTEGELLYTREEILESTHSCHTRQKLSHYRTEHYLENILEPTLAMSRLAGFGSRSWALDRAWKYVLENHAHDSLGCTSVDEVFREVMNRYDKARALAGQVAGDERRSIMSCFCDEQSLVVFNTNPFDFSGVCSFTLDIPEGFGGGDFALEDGEGAPVGLRILSRKPVKDLRYNPKYGHPTLQEATKVSALAAFSDIPAFGWKRYKLIRGGAPHFCGNRPMHFLSSEPCVMENRYLRCRINGNGTVDVTDKQTGAVYPAQFTLEDMGENGTVYRFEHSMAGKTVYSSGVSADIALLYDTPLGCAYEVRLALPIPEGKGSDGFRSDREAVLSVASVLRLDRDSKALQCRMTVDNPAKDHRLRALFPTYITDTDVSRGGQPFDFPERPIHGEEITAGVYEQPYATQPMQDICDISGKTRGLTLAAAGIYEYECIDDGSRALALTLLRANNIISRDFGTSGQYGLQEAENLCTVVHEISIIPHGADWREIYGDALHCLRNPVVTLNRAPEESVLTDYRKPEKRLPDCGSAVALSGEGLLITALKPAFKNDSVVVRVLNMSGSEKEGKLTCTFPGSRLVKAYETDLDENRICEVCIEYNTVSFRLRNAGLCTFELLTEEE